jgi:ATP-dependent DNA ligase
MKAKVRVKPPEPPGWFYEPKWDGFRMMAWSGDEPRLDSRNGKPLLRYFPELRPALDQLPPGTVVDGEVVVVRGDVTQFDQLQLRIHPAESRIARLSTEIPAQLVAFDLLAHRGEDLRNQPYAERRARLESLFDDLDYPWNLTPITDDVAVARRWFDEYEAAGCDGIICKSADGVYVEDKRLWLKWKHRRDCDCVVGGYRVHKDGDKIGSILLGVYTDAGELHFIGHCSGFSDHDRVELLKQFEQIRSDESFGGELRRELRRRGSSEGSRSREPVVGRQGPVVDPGDTRRCRRGELRPTRGRPLPARHPLRALAPRQGARGMHDGPVGPP